MVLVLTTVVLIRIIVIAIIMVKKGGKKQKKNPKTDPKALKDRVLRYKKDELQYISGNRSGRVQRWRPSSSTSKGADLVVSPEYISSQRDVLRGEIETSILPDVEKQGFYRLIDTTITQGEHDQLAAGQAIGKVVAKRAAIDRRLEVRGEQERIAEENNRRWRQRKENVMLNLEEKIGGLSEKKVGPNEIAEFQKDHANLKRAKCCATALPILQAYELKYACGLDFGAGVGVATASNTTPLGNPPVDNPPPRGHHSFLQNEGANESFERLS